ncbi:MAG: C1 family peptidase, partial [Desulfuromonadaceae bacterium]
MTEKTFPTVKAAGKQRTLNARKDVPDIRDRMYEPALVQLKPEIDNRPDGIILDQGTEGACTGFGLAAVINLLNKKKRNLTFQTSPRMLYEMAKKHDEWPGEDYAGSSCRGAIRGWKNMGVCGEVDWPYAPENPGELTIERAWAARSCTIGAYYRLRPELNDYHAALNEVGAIYVSADVHSGWFDPRTKKNTLPVINFSNKPEGGHAFAIVGYNSDGFIVQNSWGPSWGLKGFALWLYEDWLQNISDGWVFRLSIPVPSLFGLTSRSLVSADAESGKAAPKRLEIAGHFVHFDDGKFKDKGDYWSTAADIQRTAELIKESAAAAPKKFEHLLIYAHGGLNTPSDSAKRIAALKEGFKRNGIYPFHIMYDTGLVEEVKDAVLRALKGQKTKGFFEDMRERVTEMSDHLIEDA